MISLALACVPTPPPPSQRDADSDARAHDRPVTREPSRSAVVEDLESGFSVDPAFAKLVPEPETPPPTPDEALARPRPTGWLEAAVPELDGPRSVDEVRALVAKRSFELLGCYEAALPVKPELRGVVELRFSIEADGSVSGERAVGTEVFGGPRAVACMVRGVSRWTWAPREGGTTEVRYRLRFNAD